jgi:hypothetical protein
LEILNELTPEIYSLSIVKFRFYSKTSKMNSISMGEFIGRILTPTAALACLPASPKISKMRSEAPFNTLGCSVKPGVDAIKPVIFT